LGDTESARAELRKAIAGRVADGEMNYYRLLAARELGDARAEAEQKHRLNSAIEALDQPETIDAYAKFGGENTPNERVGLRSAEAAYLRGLAALGDGRLDEAKSLFQRALKERPGLVWARHFCATQ
jgi:tetratricopeptide (TPR) repeat protein